MRRLSSIIWLLALAMSTPAQESPHGEDLAISCGDCHTTQGWKMIEGTYTFDHNTMTEFNLTGQHRDVDCRSCHTTLVFSAAQSECSTCHTDVHQQSLGMDCSRCHTSESWIVNDITELHEQTRFPLLGAHSMANCIDCHTSANDLNFEPLGIECIDCHQEDYRAATDPNHVEAGFSTECTDCHQHNAFTWRGAGLDHSFFPLTKGHEIDNCFQCHTEGANFNDVSSECLSCHQEDYNTSANPNHVSLNFSTTCQDCHTTVPDWKPAKFDEHDGMFFPIYSGEHNGEWDNCADCHKNASNYSLYTCTDCHEHNQPDMDEEHDEVSGYTYESTACLGCHPTGSEENIFNHDQSNFPLTGAHTTTECADCHAEGYAGTPSDCASCHINDYNESTNPNHSSLGLPDDCASCHTTEPEWKPAEFPVHDDYYALNGAHGEIANECASCHDGDYVNTPNTCFGCHEEDYNQTTDPTHEQAQFSTDCITCHTEDAWEPATFEHDGQYFPIYSGEHQGEWDECSDCHTNSSNYAIFTCTDCHEHNQPDTDEEHEGVGGYIYESQACFECHPTGEGDGAFNHDQSNFALTGAHTTTACEDCHSEGYEGTPTACSSCHTNDYNQSTNPDHNSLGLPMECATCHGTEPGWEPASFPIHDEFYELLGAHASISNECNTCHGGDYNNTPNTCFGCHEEDYNQTTDPNHEAVGFPTDCLSCHTQDSWEPSTFDHDGQYFPIYSGEHNGEWDDCSECHTDPNNYTLFSCIDCHEHNQQDMDEEHEGVGGYVYESQACYECHPTGEGDGAFDHNQSDFPLTGAHTTTECIDCHEDGYEGTTTVCSDCHSQAYLESTNPNHNELGLPYECATCHTTDPGWEPATFPIHDDFYELVGAHAEIADNCNTCHEGDYNNTPNTCFGCHEEDYNQTTDPPHASAQFPTECELCHTQDAWIPSTFEHDAQYFPIYSGEHEGEWNTCSECHTNPNNYSIFSCIDCHEHNQQDMDEEHDEVPGYVYESTACYECHPNGEEVMKMFRKMDKRLD
ncbi:MAG: hypothetical protein K9I94_00485 [Bacteroidales bacterium]|nr:hypothetical protein [Bacteroidales bacterium]